MPDAGPELTGLSGDGRYRPTRRRLLRGLMAAPLVLSLPGLAQGGDGNAPWLVYCGSDFPPYSWANADEAPVGMDVDIVEAVLNRLGVSRTYHPMVWSRALASLDQGVPDLLFQLVPSPERMRRYRMVGPMRTGETIFAVRADSTLTFNDLNDLTGLVIGTGRSFHYLPDFDQAAHFTRDPAPSEQLSLRKLVNGRLDMVVGDRFALTWKARREGLLGAIRFLPKPLAVVPRYVAFPRDRADKADRFEQALMALITDGTIAGIIEYWLAMG